MSFNSSQIKEIVYSMLKTPQMSQVLRTYNVLTTVLLSFVTIAVVILIVFHVVKLGKAGDNARNRQEAINGLAVCSISLASLGGIDIVYAIIVSIVTG